MSVVTGKPVSAFTFAEHRQPVFQARPRNEPTLVRLALSNEALKTSCTGSLAAISFSRAAIDSVNCSVSMTHGPAITSSGWPRPHRKVRQWQDYLARVDRGARDDRKTSGDPQSASWPMDENNTPRRWHKP